jgi:hypothetical protein
MLIKFLLLITLKLLNSEVWKVKPLKTAGLHSNNYGSYCSYFISKTEVEVVEDNYGNMRLCDVLPLPISPCTSQEDTKNVIDIPFTFITASAICQRDKGVYDNLPYELGDFGAKKRLFDFCNYFARQQVPQKFMSYSHAFLHACKTELGTELSFLGIEEADISEVGAIQLGAYMVIKKSGDIHIVNIYPDELVCFSMDLDIPINIDKKLFQKCCLDAILTPSSDHPSGFIIRSALTPTFQNNQTSSQTDQDVRTVWEIFDASEFIQMSQLEKRALLKRSGVLDLPRPRDGDVALENLLVDLMDSAVRTEYWRMCAGKQNASPSVSSGSRRSELLQEMAVNLEKGDMKAAVALRECFAQMTQLRADPTQDEGSYDRFLDQDDWYMEARRRAMTSSKNKQNKSGI